MTMEKDQIANVLNLLMDRIDYLEENQLKSNEVLGKLKARLLELNTFVNDIMDVIEHDFHYEANAPVMETFNKFRHLSEAIIEESNVESSDIDKEHLKSAMIEIIGES